MTIDEQLKLWVAGESVHNDARGECCPDFSCCNKDMRTPLDVRERFLKAHNDDDEKTIMSMLGMFLGEAMSKYCAKKVYIAGIDKPTSVQ